MSPEARQLVTSWGRTAATSATVVEPTDLASMRTLVHADVARGVIARGLGRSYGDQAQNAGGVVVSTHHLDRVTALDVDAATVTVQGGVRLGTLMRVVSRFGLALPVVPGTRDVTVGGAVAADVHGKNHHRDGSIGRHVTRMSLLTADGTTVDLRPEDGDRELFWATLGGLGLTGIVLDVDLRLLRVPTRWMRVDTVRAGDLDAVLAALADGDRRRYSVAWVDCLAGGARAGRGVVTAADHADPDDVSGSGAPARGARGDPPDPDPPARVGIPPWVPPHVLNRWSVQAFNSAWFRAARSRTDALQAPSGFFHPLDAVTGWNRLYGSRGLVQYQCVVPDVVALSDLLDRLRRARAPVFLAVVKRFGAGNPGPLSFPQPGWTLAVDLGADVDGLGALLDAMDERVAMAGGSVYLAKDSRLAPELLPVFYPRLDQWRDLRDRVDPSRRWQSDLSRRLSL
jgi:decaprenylphospho-beta-D-ribofuranose 2-oxidase